MFTHLTVSYFGYFMMKTSKAIELQKQISYLNIYHSTSPLLLGGFSQKVMRRSTVSKNICLMMHSIYLLTFFMEIGECIHTKGWPTKDHNYIGYI